MMYEVGNPDGRMREVLLQKCDLIIEGEERHTISPLRHDEKFIAERIRRRASAQNGVVREIPRVT